MVEKVACKEFLVKLWRGSLERSIGGRCLPAPSIFFFDSTTTTMNTTDNQYIYMSNCIVSFLFGSLNLSPQLHDSIVQYYNSICSQ